MPTASHDNAPPVEAVLNSVLDATQDWDFESLSELVARLRDTVAGELRQRAAELGGELDELNTIFHALTGASLSVAAISCDADNAISGAPHTPARERSDTWYSYEILRFIKSFKGAGCATKRIFDDIELEGGSGAHALTEILPRMKADGLLVETEPGWWNAAMWRADDWYDHQILGFVGSFNGHGATTQRIQEMILVDGGDGAEACAVHLPRLRDAGELDEREPGMWFIPSQRRTKPVGFATQRTKRTERPTPVRTSRATRN